MLSYSYFKTKTPIQFVSSPLSNLTYTIDVLSVRIIRLSESNYSIYDRILVLIQS